MKKVHLHVSPKSHLSVLFLFSSLLQQSQSGPLFYIRVVSSSVPWFRVFPLFNYSLSGCFLVSVFVSIPFESFLLLTLLLSLARDFGDEPRSFLLSFLTDLLPVSAPRAVVAPPSPPQRRGCQAPMKQDEPLPLPSRTAPLRPPASSVVFPSRAKPLASQAALPPQSLSVDSSPRLVRSASPVCPSVPLFSLSLSSATSCFTIKVSSTFAVWPRRTARQQRRRTRSPCLGL